MRLRGFLGLWQRSGPLDRRQTMCRPQVSCLTMQSEAPTGFGVSESSKDVATQHIQRFTGNLAHQSSSYCPGSRVKETGNCEVQTAGRSARYRGLRARCQVRARTMRGAITASRRRARTEVWSRTSRWACIVWWVTSPSRNVHISVPDWFSSL